MKHTIIIGIVLVALTLLVWLTRPQAAMGDIEPVAEPIVKIVYVDKPALTPAQIIWLAHLMDCESDIDSTAINPNDLDNTPSWGILQFKPETFSSFAVKYGITGELMHPESQVAIVTHWILNPGEVRWEQQFPACVRAWGLPPV